MDEHATDRRGQRRGRKFRTSPDDLKGYGAGPRKLVATLREMISKRYDTLLDCHRALVAAGYQFSYKELSKQLNPTRFPFGPDERWALAIVDICDPARRDEIEAMCRAINENRNTHADDTDHVGKTSADRSTGNGEPPPDPSPDDPWWHRNVLVLAVALTVAVLLLVCLMLIPRASNGKFESGSCDISDSDPVVIATSGRQNSPAPTTPQRLREILQHIVAPAAGNRLAPISLVNVDGRPSLTHTWTVPASDISVLAPLKAQQSQLLSEIDGAIAATRATEPEADVLDALDLSSKIVHPGPLGGGGTIILMDSGLSTTGVLDFTTPGLLSAPPDDVVRYLQQHSAIPNLARLTIVFVGLGDVSSPQVTLPDQERQALIDLWSKIAAAGGAECVEAVTDTRGGSAPFGTPPVRTVPVPIPQPHFSPTPGSTTVLPNDTVTGFRPDTAQFLDPEGARAALQPVADFLRSHPSARIVLSGTTARYGARESQITLSLRRAMAVKDLLVSLGAPADRIEVKGLGSNFDGYVQDVGSDGSLLPGPAQANRSVRITVL